MQLCLTLYQPGREGAPGEERLCLCVAECLCYSAETAILLISHTPIQMFPVLKIKKYEKVNPPQTIGDLKEEM